jgi:1,4-dihydroxy-2-naphthoate octaprenyltransferase
LQNNLRDIETDRAAGRKNLIIIFGYKFGAAQYYFCIIVAILIPAIIAAVTKDYYISLISLFAIFLEIGPLKTVVSRPVPAPPQKLIRVLVETGRALLVFSLLFSAGWIASVYL